MPEMQRSVHINKKYTIDLFFVYSSNLLSINIIATKNVTLLLLFLFFISFVQAQTLIAWYPCLLAHLFVNFLF